MLMLRFKWTLKFLEHFGAFWNQAQSVPMPRFEHYIYQTGKAKPEISALGIHAFVKCNHSTEIKYAGKYEMRIKEDI